MGSLLASNAQENWSFVLYYYAQLDIQTLIFSIYFRNTLFNIPHIVFTTFHTGLFNKVFFLFHVVIRLNKSKHSIDSFPASI